MKKIILIGLMIIVVGSVLWVVGKQHREAKNNTKVLSTSTPIVYNPADLSLNSIFSPDHEWVATLPAEKVITLIVTGDVMLGRSVNTRNLKYGFVWPFEKVKNLLQDADVTFVNLESPIVDGCQPTDEGMYFCADPKSVEGLTFAGVDIATIANNHATNYEEKGINDTVRLLTYNNIKVAGVDNKPALLEKKGINIAFLGYNDVGQYNGIINVASRDLLQDIKNAKNLADIVVAQFHWGNEYQYEPTERQRELAHKAIDADADLVVGNHPHWYQGLELYKGKLIAYSHGNFVFDQMWSEETKTGIVGKYTFYDNQLIDAEYFPIYIENFGQANVLEDSDKVSVLNQLKQISQ